MKINHFLYRLRKSAIVLTLMLAISVVTKTIDLLSGTPTVTPTPKEIKSPITSYICTNIVQKKPVDVRYTFFEYEKRVYYYTKSDSSVYYSQHTWYNGSIVAKKHKCSRKSKICISSIDRSELTEGNWSVDFFSNKILLDAQQFMVTKRPIL